MAGISTPDQVIENIDKSLAAAKDKLIMTMIREPIDMPGSPDLHEKGGSMNQNEQ